MKSCEENHPRILVSALTSLIDVPIDIRIVGLKPHQEIEVKANRIANGKTPFLLESHAKFIADKDGIVELNSHEAISGSYTGIDGMGLFWSLEIIKVLERNEKGNSIPHPLTPQIVTLSLIIDQSIVDEINIKRLWQAENISRYSIRENGLKATFFCNKDASPSPGIILFGGSEGGIYEYPAALLASHGFSVLALAYFGVEDLPKQLVEIPLEYIEKSINWMKDRSEVAEGWLGIHGTSRGSELALLSASLFPEIRAAVALNGFAVAFSGIVPWSDDETLPPAWIYKGEPFPYLLPENPVEIAQQCKEMWRKKEGNPFGHWYQALSSDPEATKNAEIKVENINGSVLLISGEADDVDTVGLSHRAINRLGHFNSSNNYEHLIYPGAGHAIGIPYVMIGYNQGNKKDTAYASKDSWEKTIAFFEQSYASSIESLKK